MAGIRKMKVSIIITTQKAEESGMHRSKVWEGEIEILDHQEYLTMISIMGEGQPQPICQVPFAIGIGHYLWIAPDSSWENVESSVFDQ